MTKKNLQDRLDELSELAPNALYDNSNCYTEASRLKTVATRIKKSGKPTWNSGVELSDEHKQSISLSKMGKPNVKKRKSIQTPKGVFVGLSAVALAYNKTTVTIWNWMKNKPTEFYYITESDL